jgi:hypothetical protein
VSAQSWQGAVCINVSPLLIDSESGYGKTIVENDASRLLCVNTIRNRSCHFGCMTSYENL